MNFNRLKIEWKSTELHNKIQVFIVSLGTIIACVVMFNTCKQLDQMNTQTTAMQGQLNEMKSGGADTKAIVEATRMSADAAAASVAAWMIPENWVYKGIEKDHVVFQVDFRNIGKTVALEVGFTATFRFFEGTKIEQIPIYQPYQCPEIRARPGIIPPNGRITNTIISEPYSTAQLKMLTEKGAYIFIHGCAIYRDILSNKEHITEMAVIYTGADTPGPFIVYPPYTRMK
jgi:hypothetical protein